MDGSVVEELRDYLSDVMPVPKLNPVFVPVEREPGTVHIRAGPHTAISTSFVSETTDSHLVYALEQIDGETQLETVIEEFNGLHEKEVLAMCKSLYDKSVLQNAGETGSDCHGSAGVVPHTAFDESRTPAGVCDSVAVIGDSVVTPVVNALAENNVPDIHIVPVGSNNILQDQADRDCVSVRDRDVMSRVLRDVDAGVIGSLCARPTVFHEVNTVAYETGTPVLTGHVEGFDGFIGPAILPAHSPCYACFESRMTANVDDSKGYKKYIAAGEQQLSVDSSLGTGKGMVQHPVHRAVSDVVGGYLTMEMCNMLMYGQAFTFGRAVHINGVTLAQTPHDILPEPKCDVCQEYTQTENGDVQVWRDAIFNTSTANEDSQPGMDSGNGAQEEGQ